MIEAAPVVRDNPQRHRLEIDLGDGEFAFAIYELLPGAIRFTHTEVPKSHEGQGLGTAMIEAGLAVARERGLKLIPICPFFRAYLRKHPEAQDLISPQHRHLLEE